jgi:putative transposase
LVPTSKVDVQCKICGSRRTVRNGKTKGIQGWKCKICGVKFVDNHAYYGMKTPAVQVRTAIQMYYQGLSLPSICKQLQQNHSNYASISTVYKWVVKSTHNALVAAKDYHPQVGDVWVADETNMNILGKQVLILDVLDMKTCFLLASQVSLNQNVYDVRSLIDQALEQARKIPQVVLANSLVNYIEGMGYSFIIECSNGEIRPFHGILQSRTKLMGDLKRMEKVIEFVDGWRIFYNYYRPHESLGGKTPSEIAHVSHVHKNERRFRAYSIP